MGKKRREEKEKKEKGKKRKGELRLAPFLPSARRRFLSHDDDRLRFLKKIYTYLHINVFLINKNIIFIHVRI